MRSHSPPDSLLFDGLLAETYPPVPDFRFERQLIRDGFELVAGLDEAGRGPLAGPVVAACVVLDPDNIPDGLNDSKAMTAQARERLYELILAQAHVGIASASAAEIDRSNILIASLGCMRRALKSMGLTPRYALVDGRDVPPGLACAAKALVKGDARSLSIAAASIVAKVTRDRMMTRSCAHHPGYGFSRHMGYGTLEHRQAIIQLGPCPLHRMSFRPLRTD